VDQTRQALIMFIQGAQAEWRWRLRVAKLHERDWTSVDITPPERAAVEAVLGMPYYIEGELDAFVIPLLQANSVMTEVHDKKRQRTQSGQQSLYAATSSSPELFVWDEGEATTSQARQVSHNV